MRIPPRRILLTGADGFVGRAIARELRARGHRVFGTTYLEEPGPDEGRVDLTREEEPAKLPEGPFDAVIHNAGLVRQDMPRLAYFAVNTEGTRRILEWERAHGIPHHIQISSIGVYGLRAMGEDRREDRTPRQRWFGVAYQRSKAAAERVIERSGVPYTLLRLPMIVGPGDTMVAPVLGRALLDGTFFRSGSGDSEVSVICVANLPDILEAVIAKGPTCDAYNCSDHSMRWSELVGAYAAALGVGVPRRRRSIAWIPLKMADKGFLYLATNARFGAHFPNEKLRRTFGWSPRVDWRDAVRASAEGVRGERG
ncbi:MAG: NAD(P)-dependent oxidoreductase [Myxococcales bacterium]|nr:NAD(P)-dependent oxidoreductase [Myxococcales bacterium]